MSPRAPEPAVSDAEPILRFDEVLGQERVIASLRQAIERRSLAHALLFVGPEGVGKRTTALALARRLLCGNLRDDDACGVCPACVQAAAGSHPDFRRESFYFDEKKKELRETVAIDQVRAVQSFLAGQALAGGRKIVVFEEAHAFTEDAQNALLKTLEEPPRGSLVVLVCHNASRLAVTVRSRCQRLPFAPLGADALAAILSARMGLEPADAALVSAYADGSLAFATEPKALREAHERVSRALSILGGGRYPELATAARSVLSTTKGVPLDFRLLLIQLRHRMRAAAGLAAPQQLTPSAKTASLGGALRAVEAAYTATVDLGRHANRRLAAERMTLRLAESAR